MIGLLCESKMQEGCAPKVTDTMLGEGGVSEAEVTFCYDILCKLGKVPSVVRELQTSSTRLIHGSESSGYVKILKFTEVR